MKSLFYSSGFRVVGGRGGEVKRRRRLFFVCFFFLRDVAGAGRRQPEGVDEEAAVGIARIVGQQPLDGVFLQATAGVARRQGAARTAGHQTRLESLRLKKTTIKNKQKNARNQWRAATLTSSTQHCLKRPSVSLVIF